MMARLLKTGRVYVAPPNRHLLLEGNRVSREQCLADCRSDVPLGGGLLRLSAVGVVLTGTLGDGASGLWTPRQAGGITVVQEPKDAAFSEMPRTALGRAKADRVVGLADVPALLDDLVHQRAGNLGRYREHEVPAANRELRWWRDRRNACHWPGFEPPGLCRFDLGHWRRGQVAPSLLATRRTASPSLSF
jgi:hypothetical protein